MPGTRLDPVDLDQLIAPHQDATPILCADVTVYRVRDVDIDGTLVNYWHVSVKHSTPNNPAGEIISANYAAFGREMPDGLLPHEAAAALLEKALTS